MKKSALSLPLILLLTACGGGGGGKSGPTSSKAEEPVLSSTPNVQSDETIERLFTVSRERKVELKEDLSNVQNFAQSLNDYVVTFKAVSGNYKGSFISCEKVTHFDQTQRKHEAKFDSEGKYASVEITLDENAPSELSYRCDVKDRVSILGSSTIDFKKSFVVRGKKNFTSHIGVQNIETLLIMDDGILITDGMDVTTNIDRLISLEGKIVTFGEDSKTPENQPGKSGGKIHFDVKAASGKLFVELRGLDGGFQMIVPAPRTEVPKKDPALNGPCRNQRDVERRRDCHPKKGHRGYQGHAGLPGLPGGDSGSIKIDIDQDDNFKLSVKKISGKGGPGGKGGIGGKGGPGGDAYKVSWHEHNDGPHCAACKSFLGEEARFPAGPNGDKGADGEPGAKGLDGKKSDSEVLFKERNLYFNFNFDWQNF